MDLIDNLEFNQVIIFVSKVTHAIKLSELLEKNKFPTKAMHSGLSQEER